MQPWEKEYRTKFPQDSKPLFDENRFIQSQASCYDALIQGMESERFDKVKEACKAEPIPKNIDEDLKSKSWDTLHKVNAQESVFNRFLLAVMNPGGLDVRLKDLLKDAAELDRH